MSPASKPPRVADHTGGEQAPWLVGERPFGAGIDLDHALDLGGERDPEFARRQRAVVGGERGADRATGDRGDQHVGVRGTGDHAADPRPRRDLGRDELARHAAAPPPAAATIGRDRQQRVVGGDVGHQPGGRVATRVGGVHAVGVGEQDEQVGADGVGDQGRQPIVVAVAQFVVGDGIVLVDHRHAAELEQPDQRPAGVQVLGAVDEVVRIDQHLRPDQPVPTELDVVRLDETALAGGRDRLQGGHVGRTRHETDRHHAGGDRTRTTRRSPGGPSARSAATSSHNLAIAAMSMTPASSVIDAVPIFATILMTSARRHAANIAADITQQDLRGPAGSRN